ncbi:MAG: hypothetical protein M1831_002308 [Alyxoria varia]|nr:MAG: hypothetical protein M1831_002308 [Alyxoria varia]
MALPNPFRRHTSATRQCWDYTFDITPVHPTEETFEPLKQKYDSLAEQCLSRLDEVSPPPRNGLLPRQNSEIPAAKEKEQISSKRDLYALLKKHGSSSSEPNSPLSKLWLEVTTIPPWVDWAQIQRGQDVFYRYGGAALTGLAYQSLLGGMGAARVVETLARTGGFSTKVARRRLFETTQHILQCTRTPDALYPPGVSPHNQDQEKEPGSNENVRQEGGEGFASTIRVRFLHAAVRRRILKLAKERPEYYDVKAHGIPINDLDSIATIATFSATLIWVSLPRQGIFLRSQEIRDYLALWRYIAYLVGCPTDPFETPEKAKAWMEMLLYQEVHPSDTSALLANNIIRALDSQPPGYASPDMLAASTRWLNGKALSDALKIPKPSFYYYILVAGQCTFFCALCYTYRSIPMLDRRKVRLLKDVFWKIIVGSDYGLQGQETVFDFSYIPEYNTITEQTQEEKREGLPKLKGVEGRNLKAFMIGITCLAFTGWVGYKVVAGASRLLLNTTMYIVSS